jgi:DNA-binding transcriptional regulator YhcF (GntR family)
MKNKSSNKSDVVKKQIEDKDSDDNESLSVIKKNIKSLVKQAKKNGMSKNDIIKLFESEQ